MKTSIWIFIAVTFVSTGFIAGCGEDTFKAAPQADAVAVLVPTAGSQATGTVVFAKTEQGVRVIAKISNLSPGQHGFHIHEFGDCRSPDAASAGGHFNPGKAAHGSPGDKTRHMGDLGNITADESGAARMDTVIGGLQLEGPNTIVGRGIIVHADADDMQTQPTGGAGARLACGVIGVAR